MTENEMRIINFRDEEFFLNKKPKGGYRCSSCKQNFTSGGTIVFGFRPNNRYRYCYKCLSKLETVLRKGRKVPFERWDMSVSHIDTNESCMLLGDNYPATRVVSIPNLKLKLSAEGLEQFYKNLSNFNNTQNNYIITKKENQIIKNNAEERRKETINLLRWVREQTLIDYYYSLEGNKRARFLQQMIAQNSYEEPTEIIRAGEPLNLSKTTLAIFEADSNVKCAVHPLKQNIQAKYHIYEQGKPYRSLNITACLECCEDLLHTLYTILCDPFMKRAEGQHTTVTRGDNEQDCFYCGSASYIEIRWHNAIIHFCENCALKFYEHFDKRLSKLVPERQVTPIQRKQYIHIEERMLTQKRNAVRSVYTIGTKMKDIENSETEFLVTSDFYPCESDNLGHTIPLPTKYYLYTNNEKIPFNLALSTGCIPRLLSVLIDSDKRIVGYGTTLWMTKRRFLGDDHCIFCTEKEGTKYRIHIGDIEFSCCEKHRKKLISTLEALD